MSSHQIVQLGQDPGEETLSQRHFSTKNKVSKIIIFIIINIVSQNSYDGRHFSLKGKAKIYLGFFFQIVSAKYR